MLFQILLKPGYQSGYNSGQFESYVILDTTKTTCVFMCARPWFESYVILDTTKT